MKVKDDVSDDVVIDNTVTINFLDLTIDKTMGDNVDKARVTLEEPFLPFTGADMTVLLVAAAMFGVAGVALRKYAHRKA